MCPLSPRRPIKTEPCSFTSLLRDLGLAEAWSPWTPGAWGMGRRGNERLRHQRAPELGRCALACSQSARAREFGDYPLQLSWEEAMAGRGMPEDCTTHWIGNYLRAEIKSVRFPAQRPVPRSELGRE